jgi:uncharacterized protein YdhG (YjbR/CyaY superfamily)
MTTDVQKYIDAIPAEHRPLFDRLHRLVLELHPEAEQLMLYKMPAYKVTGRRLFIGAWKHGVSMYGWSKDGDIAFTKRHPKLKTSTGTIQLRPQDAVEIPDKEFRDLIRAVLG